MSKLSKKALEDYNNEIGNKCKTEELFDELYPMEERMRVNDYHDWLNEEIYYNHDCGYIDCRQCFKHENDYKLISRYKLYEVEE